jgi:hypothetical protein
LRNPYKSPANPQGFMEHSSNTASSRIYARVISKGTLLISSARVIVQPKYSYFIILTQILDIISGLKPDLFRASPAN